MCGNLKCRVCFASPENPMQILNVRTMLGFVESMAFTHWFSAQSPPSARRLRRCVNNKHRQNVTRSVGFKYVSRHNMSVCVCKRAFVCVPFLTPTYVWATHVKVVSSTSQSALKIWTRLFSWSLTMRRPDGPFISRRGCTNMPVFVPFDPSERTCFPSMVSTWIRWLP